SPVFIFTRSGANELPNMRTFSFPGGVAQAVTSTLVRAGNAAYTLGTSPGRWGDYQGIGIDPSSPGNAWAVGEYPIGFSATSGDWGTWIAQIGQDPRTAIQVLNLATNDLIWDPGTARIYASVPGNAAIGAN